MRDSYTAIWDTGATNTVISEELAHNLNLTPIGKASVSTAGGIIEVNKYVLGLKLPNNLQIQNVMVTAGKLNGTDFLIGMDIITHSRLDILLVKQLIMLSKQKNCNVKNYKNG